MGVTSYSNYHTDSIFWPPILITPVVSQRSPKEKKLEIDHLKEFQEKDKVESFESFSQEHTPSNFSVKWLQESAQYHHFVFDYICISIDKELHLKLTFQGFLVRLPDLFCIGHNCAMNKFSMLEGFFSNTKNRSDSFCIILIELNLIQHYKPQRLPNFASLIIPYALLLHDTPCQSYKLLLKHFPPPPLSLLKNVTSGFIDLVKAAKLLLEKEATPKDCVLLLNEMYLQMPVQF